MSSKLQKSKIRILEPFAVFVIIAGLGINITLPFLRAGSYIPETELPSLKQAIWIGACAFALLYTVAFLKYMLKGQVGDRILWIFVICVFASLIAFSGILFAT